MVYNAIMLKTTTLFLYSENITVEWFLLDAFSCVNPKTISVSAVTCKLRGNYLKINDMKGW